MLRVDELPVPESLDGPGGADFAATVEVRNAVECALYGTPEVSVPADEILVHWHDPHEPQRLWAVRDADRIVARGILGWQLGSTEVAWITIQVLPDHVGAGIGGALHEVLEREARAAGFDRMVAYAVHPPGDGEQLTPPTGFGAIPAGNREVRFLRGRGWRLEQVERGSRIALPVDEADLDRRLAGARTAAGPDYAVHTWQGPTPASWLADQAVLRTRMSTDAPSAGLEEPEDVWDAARVAAHDERMARGPRTTLTAVAEHLPTGRLVGYTQLAVPHDLARPVTQEDTLVLREHRGHRLGMLLKVANLAQLQRVAPGHTGLLTWNAEENRPMLDVNEAVGFVPIGYEGAWRKDLR
jgi:GNAT superfamily N-acetyltransferase